MPNYNDDDLLPISALQHLAFCERQCALIHIEQIWDENRWTAEGRLMHERTHEATSETRGDTRTSRGLRLRSLRLGLTGVADVVEFHHEEGAPETHVRLPKTRGRWRPFPVEYKRGRPKKDNVDAVQLCAQAFCLEEMLDVAIADGALFYGKTRRRQNIAFTNDLRSETEELAIRLRALINSNETPPARRQPKCDQCSLLAQCRPEATNRRGVDNYMDKQIDAILGDDPQPTRPT